MDYIYYILFILGVMALCLLLVRLPGRKRLKTDKPALSERARIHQAKIKHAQRSDKRQVQHDHEVLKRELAKVPTPWGWPGHHEAVPHVDTLRFIEAEEVRGFSESLHRFVDHLLREKHTVDSQEFRSKRDASLRAMVEDRYGHPVDMRELYYRKVQPPLLRDPAAPYDQMDNFGSGKITSIKDSWSRQPSLYEQQLIHKKTTRLKEIRKPWGW